MKLITILILSLSTNAFADTYVRGHTRSDGTYVEPHYRSNPNSNKFDNYSTQGNVNPHNGNEGRVDPYYTPPSQYQAPRPYNYNNPYDNN